MPNEEREQNDGVGPSFFGGDDVGHTSEDGEAFKGGENELVNVHNLLEVVDNANEIYSEDGKHNSDYNCSRGWRVGC